MSFAGRSAFSVRGADAAAGGGLRVELAQGERLRAGMGLRLDSGRRESDSAELRGMGDVRGALNLRLSVSSRPLAGVHQRQIRRGLIRSLAVDRCTELPMEQCLNCGDDRKRGLKALLTPADA